MNSILAKKKAEGPGAEKMQELYYQSQFYTLKENYRPLNSDDDFKEYLGAVQRKHTYPNLYDIELFALKDAVLQTAISKDISGLVSFIESTFYINIVMMRSKFVLSKEMGVPIFCGATECYFQFKSHELESIFSWGTEIKTDILIDRFNEHKFKSNHNPFKFVNDVPLDLYRPLVAYQIS